MTAQPAANTLRPAMLGTASRLMAVSAADLGIHPATEDFAREFQAVLAETGLAA